MSEWASTRLGDVTSQVRDLVKVVSREAYPLLGVKWYAEGPFLREVVTSETSRATRFYRVQPGQFIYNRLFAWKGSFGIVGDDLAGSYVSNEFPLFDCDRSRLLPEFLNLYFGQPSLWSYVERVSTGTTASRSRWKEVQFNELEIPLPSPSEQRRIVDVVAAVDLQIESVQREQECAIESVRRARVSLLSVGARGEWQREVTDSHTPLTWTEQLPAGWSPETIGTVSVVRSGATPRRSEQARYFDGGSIPWVKTGDLNEGLISETDECITDVGFAESSVRLLPADTILVAMYGGFGQIGRTGRLGVPATTNQAISALTDLRPDVIPAYLHQALKAGRPKWRLVAASSRKDPNISKRDVENFDFPLPGPDEQREIVDILEDMESATDTFAAELHRLNAFRSALLTSLLNQEIEIPVSYDRLLEEVS